jgi:Putative Actinobacterial Holin-X, holin superfamily III
VSSGQAPGENGRSPGRGPGQQGIAAAITEVTERASVLIREEIELAKTEITEKTTRLAKGAVVGIVAGVFFFTALFFVLIGCAWLLYYELPIGNEFTYFWGFFAMAVILVVLGVIAGLLAYRAVKAGAPPTPDMAIEEARKIRETVSSSSSSGQRSASVVTPTAPSVAAASSTPAGAAPKPAPAASESPAETGQDSDLGRGTIDGTTLGS